MAGTVSSLAVRSIDDPVAMGSVATFASLLGALLSEREVTPAAFVSIYSSFSKMPHDESYYLSVLFGACLHICLLATEFDEQVAAEVSNNLFVAWNKIQESTIN